MEEAKGKKKKTQTVIKEFRKLIVGGLLVVVEERIVGGVVAVFGENRAEEFLEAVESVREMRETREIRERREDKPLFVLKDEESGNTNDGKKDQEAKNNEEGNENAGKTVAGTFLFDGEEIDGSKSVGIADVTLDELIALGNEICVVAIFGGEIGIVVLANVDASGLLRVIGRKRLNVAGAVACCL